MIKIKEWKNKLTLTVLYAAVLTILWILDMPCLWKHFLGFICPGCGMSRAVLCLLKLDFVGAFNLHPMVFSLPVLYAYFLFDKNTFKNRVLYYGVLIFIAVGFLANWIFKLFVF